MIQILDKATINKIAAGEVIERPMAVVKELVENAIDSGATAITVEIKQGGRSLIRVTDDGCGIQKEEIRTAFLPHATSKIRYVEDLLSVRSLGFRGEALASISAVSQVECISKTKDDITGSRYEIHGGKEIAFEDIGCPNGTTFIIRNIFYNTPARKKFLKSNITESNYICETIERFALAHAEISFTYLCDGKNKLQSSGNGNCRNNIFYIYGKEIEKELIPFTGKKEEDITMEVSGFIGKPSVSRGTRSFINTFINGRYIKSNLIQKAILDAYQGYTMIHRYPFALINLNMNSSLLDVNVHPTKMEVRFSDEESVYELLYQSIKNALDDCIKIPTATFEQPQKKETAVYEQPSLPPEPFETQRREQRLYENQSIPPTIQEESLYHTEKQNRFTYDAISQDSLEQDTKPEIEFRIIGQVFKTYWLIEYQDELLIIDQHAAHEKVMYEKLVARMKCNEHLSQNLLAPIIVTLSVMEEETLKKYRKMIQSLGFLVEPFGGHEYAISAVPIDFYGLESETLFLDFLDEMMTIGNSTPELLLDKMASMSCKAAVKGNHELSYAEAKALISSMLTLENPYHCPHGRPTTISLSKQEFEKKFKRIVS